MFTCTKDFAQLQALLLNYSASKSLRKKDGWIYTPVPSCPCAYKPLCTYEEYINKVLNGNPIFTSDPKRFRDAMEYLRDYHDDEMPLLVPDKSIISFANGVLDIFTMEFVEYCRLPPDMLTKTARHHIDQEYIRSTETPLLDVIFDAQFSREVADILLALMGRALFDVNALDTWQVMGFLVGISGTGKSAILVVLQHFFAPEAIGNLAAKREEVFGMANLIDKEIVIGRNVPGKLYGYLPENIMQAMIGGEPMEIRRKGLIMPMTMTWKAPLIMAGTNDNCINKTLRQRVVSIRFNKVVTHPKEFLQRDIVKGELPNVICRALQCYKALRERVDATGNGFWGAVPKEVLVWQG
jgi:phage/plasmid-associated DNA primase